MRPLPRLIAVLVVAAGIYGLASCSSTAGSAGSAPGKPVYGGTLRVISNTGPGTLDPVPTYNYAGYELERGYTRQLVTYPTTSPAAATGRPGPGPPRWCPTWRRRCPPRLTAGSLAAGLCTPTICVPACTGTRRRRGR